MSSPSKPSSWSRREMLAAGCLMVLGAGRSGRTATIDGKVVRRIRRDPYSPFKMGLQSYSLRGLKRDGRSDLGKALAATKSLGLHYWESYTAHVPMNNPQGLENAKRALEAAGVTLAAYGVVPLGKNSDANRRIFDFAKSLGLEYVSAPIPIQQCV